MKEWRVVMRKITYFVPILFLIIIFSLSSGGSESIKGPRIFLPEKEWDFGYIPQGSTVSHFFTIKNIGGDTLQIVKVRSGCICTYAPLKKDILAPRDSTILEVIFNSKNYQGQKTMSVVIFSTDTSTLSDIYFTANVENEFPLVQIEPLQVEFDSLKVEKATSKKVTLLNKSNSSLQMVIVERPQDFIDFQISKNSLNPKEKAEIAFQINHKASSGLFRSNLTLDFRSGGDKIRYTLPINGTIISK